MQCVPNEKFEIRLQQWTEQMAFLFIYNLTVSIHVHNSLVEQILILRLILIDGAIRITY